MTWLYLPCPYHHTHIYAIYMPIRNPVPSTTFTGDVVTVNTHCCDGNQYMSGLDMTYENEPIEYNYEDGNEYDMMIMKMKMINMMTEMMIRFIFKEY